MTTSPVSRLREIADEYDGHATGMLPFDGGRVSAGAKRLRADAEAIRTAVLLLEEARRVVEPFATCIATDERENAILGEPVRSDEDWLDARVAHFRSAAAFLEKLGSET